MINCDIVIASRILTDYPLVFFMCNLQLSEKEIAFNDSACAREENTYLYPAFRS